MLNAGFNDVSITKMWSRLLVLITTIASLYAASTTTSYLSVADRERLKNVFIFDLNDIPSLHYAVLGYKLLGVPIPETEKVCKAFLNFAGSATSPETLYYATSAWKSIGKCQGTFPTSKVLEVVASTLKQDGTSAADLYYIVNTYKLLGQKLTSHVDLIKSNLQALLKKDDSISNLGYSFHVASHLGNDGVFAFERIEDAVVQADEVDGRYLQFEGGLSITALLVSGAYKLAQTVNKPPPITGDQVVKFANYFLSRRSVQTPKGAYSLLEVMTTVSDNKHHVPVTITLAGPAAVSTAEPKVSVKVCDLLGRPLSTGPFSVTAESASRVSDDVIVLSKKKFEPVSSDPTIYAVNLMEVKPEPGLYKVSVNALPSKTDARLVGNVGVTLLVKVMCSVAIDSIEVGVADADQTTQPKFERILYTSKLSKKLEVDALQKLIVKFTLKDKSTNKLMLVHQAFVRFSNAATNQEIIFIAEPDSAKMYRFDLNLGAKQAEFKHLSGTYSVELIVGDVVISNSFSWKFADVNLKLSVDSSKASESKNNVYQPKPEIQHIFREPEKRPPVFVSNLFTGLVFVPFLVLVVLWGKLGINISNFPFSLSAVGFHIGLGGIFVLFGFFWLKLNMFQTLKYLFGLGVITFLCGNKLLAKIASNRKHH
ncbi:oligosaccharide transferase delta subunit isoform X2 [Lycorma delicatula]|uniref:oligosaccharide transferase delta subunit isoform X2 n=1 Tax=Lycorma delicatula TaxID=130591 RepID=UPI003F5108B8